MRIQLFLQATMMVVISTGAFAAGTGHTHDGPAGPLGAAVAFGEPGDPKAKARTVQVDMLDNGTMRFSPARLVIKRGETIRFKEPLI